MINPYSTKPLASEKINIKGVSQKHRDFLEFVLFKYVDTGVVELDQSKLAKLIELKYHTVADATVALGGVDEITNLFFGFQKHLYEGRG